MKGLSWLAVACVLLAGSQSTVRAEDEREQGLAQSKRYHQVLRQRPEPGYLFDRFYNGWLDYGSVEELESFLTEQVETVGETSDRLLLAFFYLKQGESVGTLQTLESALEAEPDHAAARYHLARLRLQMLDFDGAIEQIEKAAQSPADGELKLEIGKLRGRLYARIQQTEKARQAWSELLQQHGDDEYLYEDLIDLQIEEGLYDEAIATVQRLVQATADPYQRVVRQLREGDVHQRAGRRDEALAVYAGTLADVGGGTWLEQEIFAQIEQVYRREDDVAGLRDYFAELLEQHPQRVPLRVTYAELLSELDETDAALEQWQQILELTPGETQYREAYVDVLAGAGRHQEAIDLLDRLIGDQRPDGELLVRRAELQHEAGQAQAAAATLHRYLDESDGSLFAYLRTTRLMERFQLTDEALTVYERMRAAHEDDTAAVRAHAEFLYRIDRTDEAVAIWQAVAEEAGLTELLNVAHALSGRGEHDAAWEALHGRLEDFEEEPRYLAELSQLAMRLNRHAEALPWARRRLELVTDDRQFAAALSDTAQMAERSEQIDALVQELQELDQRTVAQTCLLAELLERRGQREQAEAVLVDAEDAHPVRILQQRARLYQHRRDWRSAAQTLEQLAERPGGRNAANLRQIAEHYARALETDKALQWVESWKQVAPTSALPWTREAELHVAAGNSQQAIETLRRAIRRFDSDHDLRARLAELYRNQGQLADAQRIYEQLYEETDEMGAKLGWVAELATVAEQRGQTRALVEAFERRRQTNRGNIVPYLALAEIHRVNDNYEQRRQALMEATRIDPDNVTLLLGIARIEEREGDEERALATLERAVEIDDSGRAQQQMARIYLRQGSEERAYELLYELAGGERIDARGIEQIADAMAGNADWERAAMFLQQHAPRFPDDYRLMYLHGVALEEAGMMDAAAERFLAVLHAQQEVTTTRTPDTSQFGQYEAELRRFMPPDAIPLIRIMEHSHQAYSHHRPNVYGVPIAMSAGGATVTMPTRLEQAQQYALIHLKTVAWQLDEPEREMLVERVREAGVPLAAVLLAMPADRLGMGLSMTPEVMDEHGDEPAVASLWIMERMSGQLQPGDADRAAEYFALFRERYPEVALVAGLLRLRELGADGHEWFEQHLQPVMQGIEQPSVFALMVVAQQLSGEGFGIAGGGELPAEIRAALSDQLLSWYPQSRTSPSPWGDYVFMMVSQVAMQQDDLRPYVRLLDDEVEAWQSSRGSAAGPMSMMAAMTGRGQLLAPMSFPPASLPDLPPHVMSLLSPEGRNPFGRAQVDPAALREALDEAGHDLLKILLANLAEDEQTVEAALARLLEAETPSVSAYILAAAWAGDKQDDPQRAVELMNRARFLPMTAEQRRQVDAAIVAWAMELDEQVESREMGRQAALRLRQGHLDTRHRQELMVALEELALTEEAQQLEREMQASRAASSGVQVSPGVSGRQSDQIEQLIDRGRRDRAVTLAARQLQQWGQAQMTSGGRINRWEIDQLRQVLARHDLIDEVLEHATPAEGASTSRQMAFGAVCELLGKTDPALAVYEAVLEDRPHDGNLRGRLAILTAERDPAAAADHLLAVPARTWQTLGQQITAEMFDHQHGDADQMFARLEMLCHWLEQYEVDPQADLSWLTSVIVQAYGTQHVGGRTLPGVYTQQVGERVQELHERRVRLYRKLSERMMAVPAVAAEGFKHRLALAEHEGEDLEPFVERARQILAQPPVRQRFGGVVHHHASDRDEPVFRDPQQFLVHHAWRQGDPSLVDTLVVDALEESGRGSEVNRARVYAALYFVAEDEFVEEAAKFIRLSAAAQPFHGMPDTAGIRTVVQVWSERELGVDLVPLVAEQLEQLSQSGGFFNLSSFVHDLALQLQKAEGGPGVRRLFAAIAESLLGPIEEREALVQQHYNRRSVSSGTVNARIHAFYDLARRSFERTSHQPVVTLAALEQLLKSGLKPEHALHMPFELTGTLQPETAGEVEAAELERLGLDPGDERVRKYGPLLVTIGNSALVDDVHTFTPYQHGAGSSDSVLAHVAHILEDDSEARGVVVDWLQEKEERTFGEGLLLAMLDSPGGPYQFLAEHEAALDAMPDHARRALASAARSWADPGDAGDEAQAMRRRLQQIHQDAGAGEVEAFLNARTLDEVNVDAFRLPSHLAHLALPLIDSDREQAKAVVRKGVELVREAERSGTGSVSTGVGGATAANYLVEQMPGEGGPELLALTAEVIRDELERPIEISGNWHAVHRLMREAEGSNVEKLGAVVASFEAHSGGGDVSYLLPMLNHQMSNLSKEDLLEVAGWLEAAPMELEDAPMHREAGRLATLLLAERHNADVDVSGIIEHYAGVLADESLSVTYRLALAQALVPLATSPMLYEQAGRVFAEATARSEVPVLDQQLRTIALGLASDEIERDEAWKEVAEAVLDGFLRRPRAPAGQTSHVSEPMTNLDPRRRGRPAMPPPMAVLKLALVQGDDQAAGQLVRDRSLGLAEQIATWVLLARGAQYELAAELMQRHATDTVLTYPTDVDFDDTVAQATEGLIAAVEDPPWRYFAELMLAAAPDADGYVDPDQGERLAALAERFDELEAGSPLRPLALLLLSHNDAALERMRDAIAAEVTDWNAFRVLGEASTYAVMGDGRRSPERHLQQRLLMAHLQAQALGGNFEPWVSLFQRVGGTTDQNLQWQMGNVLQAMAGVVELVVADRLAELGPDDLAQAVAATRKLTNPPNWAHQLRHEAGRHADLHQLALIAANETQELESWRQSELGSSRRSNWSGLQEQLRLLLLKPQPVPVERRVAFLAEVFSDGALDQRGPAGVNKLAGLVEAELLSEQELLEHGPRIAKTGPRGGRTWAELAIIFEKHDREAGPLWENACAAVRNMDDLEQVADRLQKTGHIAMARELVAEFAVDNDDKDAQQKRQELLQSLEESKQEESEQTVDAGA